MSYDKSVELREILLELFGRDGLKYDWCTSVATIVDKNIIIGNLSVRPVLLTRQICEMDYKIIMSYELYESTELTCHEITKA